MIEGVKIRQLKKFADERGFLCETLRSDWDEFEEFTMSYFSYTYPGIIRAWHRHLRGQNDYFVVPKGMVKVAVYDDRDDSPTKGEVNDFVIGEDNMVLLVVPGACWHGFKVVGNEPAILVNCPTRLYDYKDPDEERIPYDSKKIPYDWEKPPHK